MYPYILNLTSNPLASVPTFSMQPFSMHGVLTYAGARRRAYVLISYCDNTSKAMLQYIFRIFQVYSRRFSRFIFLGGGYIIITLSMQVQFNSFHTHRI